MGLLYLYLLVVLRRNETLYCILDTQRDVFYYMSQAILRQIQDDSNKYDKDTGWAWDGLR
jgi:hypothetical protein